MNTSDTARPRAYAVRAEYFSGRDLFAVETFTIDVVDGLDPYAIAKARADESVYADSRVPELACAITLEPVDPEDPDPQPPSGAVKPVCPHCGSDDLTRDATARWDVDSQSWDLSGIFDCQTCGSCGAEGDEFARWLPVTGTSMADQFMWALADALQNASLALDAAFQLFCLNVHEVMTIEQASAAWGRTTSEA